MENHYGNSDGGWGNEYKSDCSLAQGKGSTES